MQFMTFVYEQSAEFWKSVPVLLAIVICDGLLFEYFVRSLPRRFEKKYISVLLFAAFCCGYFWLQSRHYEVLRHSLLFLIVLTSYLFAGRRGDLKNALFISFSFVMVTELARTLVKDGLLPDFLLGVFPTFSTEAINIILLTLCMLASLLITLLISPIIRKYRDIPISLPQLILLMIPLALYLFARHTKFYVMTGSFEDATLLLRMQIAEITVCICSISVTAVLANMVSAQQEINRHLKTEMHLRAGQEQYRIKTESIAAVNRKYHDIKHMLAGIRAMNQAEAAEFAASLEKELSPFECVQETGNNMINILLTEKILECREKNIRFVTYVDASELGFVNDMDLCSLFGNAVDNAIEATLKCPEGHREVYIKIHRTGDMVLFCIQNSFEGNLNIQNGRLITVKPDKSEHGFGTENIRRIAEKYNGTSAFEAEEHMFTLNILLPIPQSK